MDDFYDAIENAISEFEEILDKYGLLLSTHDTYDQDDNTIEVSMIIRKN